MGAAQTLISVREYLSTSYQPDVDYVDGEIEERNVGEIEHSRLQGRIFIMLTQLRMRAFVEARLRVSATRFRVPDVLAYETVPNESVFVTPPNLCVEILSPEDRLSRTLKAVQEYLLIGVPTVWVLDPLEKTAYVATHAEPFRQVRDRIATADGKVEFTLEQVFSDEDLF
jgi:Uma2 family endonuclease